MHSLGGPREEKCRQKHKRNGWKQRHSHTHHAENDTDQPKAQPDDSHDLIGQKVFDHRIQDETTPFRRADFVSIPPYHAYFLKPRQRVG